MCGVLVLVCVLEYLLCVCLCSNPTEQSVTRILLLGIRDHQGGIPESGFSENVELGNPEIRQI